MGGCLALAVLLLGALASPQALAFTVKLNVVDENGAPVNGFRWQAEEDTTPRITPGEYQPPEETVRLSIIKTHQPVVKTGHNKDSSAKITLPGGKRYLISVLPDLAPDGVGYSMGGVQVKGGGTFRVTVRKNPIPTAQISILVFWDTTPINNAPDVGEWGIPGFKVNLTDVLGDVAFDAFGKPLGTTYEFTDTNGNGVHDPGEPFNLDPDGNPIVVALGNGVYTDEKGEAVVKFLPPGKYGVRVVPRPTILVNPLNPADTRPFPDPNVWSLTSTIEGTPTVDAWVAADEPLYFVEFGRSFRHTFFGFVHQPWDDLGSMPVPSGGSRGTIHGFVKNVHQSRPPAAALNPGAVVPEAWVGLNVLQGGLAGKGVYAAPADPETGEFSIAGVPTGTYQVVAWDTGLDQIFAFQTVIIDDAGNGGEMGDMLVNAWFGRMEGKVFYDTNGNGFPDADETQGVNEQAVNLRFRDGRIYQATLTGLDGSYELKQIFPWFRWIVGEVDFLRYDATGATVVVDDGGAIPVDSGWAMPSQGVRNPQAQVCSQGDVDAGVPECLTAGSPRVNPNTGNVYSKTDQGPVLLQAMIVYADQNHRVDWGKRDYRLDPLNGGISGIVFYDTTRHADDPYDSAGDPWEPGVPKVRVNLYRVDLTDPVTGRPTEMTMINSVLTDSWDESLPEGCVHPSMPVLDPFGGVIDPCAEFLRTWNQVRPGVFDGGYAFVDGYEDGIQVDNNGQPLLDKKTGALIPETAGQLPTPLATGQYVVEVVPPTGYLVTKEEDKNVDFGDRYKPGTKALAPLCVGPDHLVPAELALFPGVPVREDLANTMRPLCNMKMVDVVPGRNAPVDHFIFTTVPKASRFHGFITNDLTNTFDPNDPNFAEKLSPQWLPITVRDWAGTVLAKTYSDQWGAYNITFPSTHTVSAPIPTGVSPQMAKVCLNDPGPDLTNPDPFYNPAYGVVCYVFDAWPAATTPLDTPVIPVGAFTGAFQGRLDCEYPNGTPRIKNVVGGPWVSGENKKLKINSMGAKVEVANPDYSSALPPNPTTNPPTIFRDYGFGKKKGTVMWGGTPLIIEGWSANEISVKIPKGVVPGAAQLTITRGDNLLSTVNGITLTVGGPAPIYVEAGQSIQAAIDAAAPGALIIVRPGVFTENLIMHKPVKLQGSGEGTVLNGFEFTPEVAAQWLAKINGLVEPAGVNDLVPFQRTDFFLEQGAAITVLGDQENPDYSQARIDGFHITMAVLGGGVFVNGYVDNLTISNNRIASNYGNFGGGVRAGWPSLVDPATGQFQSADVTNLKIHHNHFNQNGALDGGGGISLFTGSDNYQVTENFLCGCLSGLNGAGITHYGESPGGLIAQNRILFNETTTGDKPIRGTIGGKGGGILIAGEEPVGGALSPGAGSVVIHRNLIQGNAASHDGGGIALAQVNGQDAEDGSPDHSVGIYNNIIVNNVAQLAGGGIALSDALLVNIINDTIAHNDSTATNVAAFTDPLNNPNLSTAQPGAGIASRATSAGLLAVVPGSPFSNPVIQDSIVFENRSFYWDGTQNGGLGALLPPAATPSYSDLGVIGTTGALTADTSNILTGGTPNFALAYFNELFAAGAGGEGGNFVSVVFRPLKQTGDYHITAANNAGGDLNLPAGFQTDYDGQARTVPVDAGADER
jgi:hypothetical protein